MCWSNGWNGFRHGNVPAGPRQDETVSPGGGTKQTIQVRKKSSLILINLFNCLCSCRNIRHTFKTILKEEGGLLSGSLYRGLLPTLAVRKWGWSHPHNQIINYLCVNCIIIFMAPPSNPVCVFVSLCVCVGYCSIRGSELCNLRNFKRYIMIHRLLWVWYLRFC